MSHRESEEYQEVRRFTDAYRLAYAEIRSPWCVNRLEACINLAKWHMKLEIAIALYKVMQKGRV